jgi:tetratricopeptide (TPR) repeat protein
MALLKKGAAADRNSARVSIMMGRVWMEKGDYAKAVESLERVIDQDKELVGETLEMLQTCYQQLGKPMNGNFPAPLRGGKRRSDRRTDAGADPRTAGRRGLRKTMLPASWSASSDDAGVP